MARQRKPPTKGFRANKPTTTTKQAKLSTASKKRLEKFKSALEAKVNSAHDSLDEAAIRCHQQKQQQQHQQEQANRAIISSSERKKVMDAQYKLLETKITMQELRASTLQAKLESHVYLCDLSANEVATKAKALFVEPVKKFQVFKETAITYLKKLNDQGSSQLSNMDAIHKRFLDFADVSAEK